MVGFGWPLTKPAGTGSPLHLDDGRDLMFYRMRGKMAWRSVSSSSVLVDAEGTTRLVPGRREVRTNTHAGRTNSVAYGRHGTCRFRSMRSGCIEAAFDDQVDATRCATGNAVM